ncbi:MAG: helix-turn-helix domain-containing protein [Actinoplanes sp.]
MPYVKYTREILAEAVAASTTMAGVLRFLGLSLNGGSHAHLRRRIIEFGIDTSHFLGRAHNRGTVNPRRLHPDAILVLRPPGARRQAPTTLRRALEQSRRPYRCAECDVGATWNGRPLTLQVDHIDGCFWDCRPENLRFLCPNCHTQTTTYAGRNRPRRRIPLVRVDEHGEPVEPVAQRPLDDQERVEVLHQVGRREMTVVDAARTLGCSPSQVRELRKRWAERGTLTPSTPRRRARRHRTDIIAFALANPSLGPRKLAAALRDRRPDPIVVSASTIATLLKEGGLNNRHDRAVAAGAQFPGETV